MPQTHFLQKPDAEGRGMTRAEILAQMDVAMGGRVAEELIYGYDEVTTGAGQDMKVASSWARSYVLAYSMSKLGLTTYDRDYPPSSATAAVIDKEVDRLLTVSAVPCACW